MEINSSLKVHVNDIYSKPNKNKSREPDNIIDNRYSVLVLRNEGNRDKSSTVMKEEDVYAKYGYEYVNTEKKSKEELTDMTDGSVAQEEDIIMIDNVLYSSNSTLNE